MKQKTEKKNIYGYFLEKECKSKYKPLLDDSQVKRWYKSVCEGANTTGDVYMRKLGNFCEKLGVVGSILSFF